PLLQNPHSERNEMRVVGIGTWESELWGTDPLPMYGAGHCKWFNVRMGFGFISMTSRGGNPIDPPMDVFVHQSKLHMEGFRSLKEGEAVEFTFKKSSKGLECVRVTGPGGVHCVGSEKRPKGKSMQQKRKPKGDRCYNCGGLDHHAKECCLPPQPKKCHYCQSATHMVAHCPHKASSQSWNCTSDCRGFLFTSFPSGSEL
uniref:Lin-28 homolog A n=1 Tax=Pygocentrus nattereri TaxID=42514 RepID=A0AAR2LCI2_PYGNA